MDKITKKFCIKKHKKGYYNLNNIVKNIIKSKNPTSYMDKIKLTKYFINLITLLYSIF